MTIYARAGPILTVTGANGVVQRLDFAESWSSAVVDAAWLLYNINTSVTGGSMIAALAENAPTVPIGKTGLLQVNAAGQYLIPTGYSALIDNASAAATVFGGTSNGQLVIAANGGLTFSAGTGAGTVIAGGGISVMTTLVGIVTIGNAVSVGNLALPTSADFISVGLGAGAQNIITGQGDDTIVALFANNTINAGYGRNMILSQGGDNYIVSGGNDLISVPDGNATIIASSPYSNVAPTVFLGDGHSQFINSAINGSIPKATIVVGRGAATVTSYGADQIWMSVGGGVVNSRGTAMYQVADSHGNPLIFSTGGGGGVGPTAPCDTIIGGSGAVTVNTAPTVGIAFGNAANDFVFAGTGALNFIGGLGFSTILGNDAGTASITGGAGSVIAIAYGQTNFIGGAGAATVAAFGGSVTVNGGAGTGVYLGGPGGNNRMIANSGHATMIGGGDGDVLTASLSGNDVFQAMGGAETLSALGTNGTNKFYAGSGADLILLGNGGDQVLAGTGSATVIAGNGADLIALVAGNHADVTIENFTLGTDFISLVDFAANEGARALASATTLAGAEQLTLSDGTKILFVGVTGLTASSFL